MHTNKAIKVIGGLLGLYLIFRQLTSENIGFVNWSDEWTPIANGFTILTYILALVLIYQALTVFGIVKGFNFFNRGKIEILPEKYNYTGGETVRGKVTISLKKPTKGSKFSLWLIAQQTTTHNRVQPTFGTSRVNSSRTETTTTTLFEFELPLDTEKEYTQGEYPFEITIPASVVSPSSQNMPNGVLGNVVSVLGSVGGMPVSRIEWNLEAILDIPGALDMRKYVQINVA